MNNFNGYRVQELFDPVQTHAAYGVPANCVDQVKHDLKEHGAKRFRVVTANDNSKIICFKLK